MYAPGILVNSFANDVIRWVYHTVFVQKKYAFAELCRFEQIIQLFQFICLRRLMTFLFGKYIFIKECPQPVNTIQKYE